MNLSSVSRLQLEEICRTLLKLVPVETSMKVSDQPEYIQDLFLAQRFQRQDEHDSIETAESEKEPKYRQGDLDTLSLEIQSQFVDVLGLPSNQPTVNQRIIRILGYLDKLEPDADHYHPEPSSDELVELFRRIDLTQYEIVEEIIEERVDD